MCIFSCITVVIIEAIYGIQHRKVIQEGIILGSHYTTTFLSFNKDKWMAIKVEGVKLFKIL
jgi:hypothetical protein